MTMTNPFQDPCLRCRALAACVGHFFFLLQESPELAAALEKTPDCLIHFVLDPRSLQDDGAIAAIELEVIDDDDAPYLLLKDTLVEDIWDTMAPTVRMDAHYEELEREFRRRSSSLGRGCGTAPN